MVKKTHYTATIGATTFTRTSARTYTHCVVSAGSLAEDRARIERWARHNWKLNLNYRQCCAEGRAVPGSRYDVSPADQEEAKQMLALGEDGLVARELARFDAEHEGQPDHYWIVQGWCGRPDLAASLAHRTNGQILTAVAA